MWESDVALFIDWENLKFSLASVAKLPNISALMEAVGEYGRLVIARAYADWEDPYHLNSRDQMYLYESGIEPVYVPSRPDPNRPDRRKNSVDVKMSTDCMEVSFTNGHIHTFVLVSGDADFLHIANSLRSRGNRVIMIGVSWSTSHRISERVDDLIYYDHEIDGARSQESLPHEPDLTGDLDGVVERLVRLVREQREEGRYPLLSWLGHQMRRSDPRFSPQAYGFEKFKDLMRYAEQKGAVRIVTQGLVDWALLPEDEVPEESLEDLSRSQGPGGVAADAGAREPGPFLAPSHHPVLASENPLEEYEPVFVDIVCTADEIEADRRYDFMTPGFLGQCLWRKGHWDPATLPPGASPACDLLKDLRAGQIRKLIDYAVEEGILHSIMRYDAGTGKTFPIVQLNRSHSFVQHLLKEEPEEDRTTSDLAGAERG